MTNVVEHIDPDAPSPRAVRRIVDEAVYATAKTLIKNDEYRPDDVEALAALLRAAAEYKAQALELARFRASQGKEARRG